MTNQDYYNASITLDSYVLVFQHVRIGRDIDELTKQVDILGNRVTRYAKAKKYGDIQAIEDLAYEMGYEEGIKLNTLAQFP